MARERAEELVRLVTDLYGAGLERLLEIVHDAGRLDDGALDALAGDELVASLLLVHGLHPVRRGDPGRAGAGQRAALPRLARRRCRAAGGGRRRHGPLRLLGTCDGCPSSAVTLKLAVEGAIEAAAPEVTAIEVEEEPAPRTGRRAGTRR